MINKISVSSIDMYQQYISPYKGYRCAYRYYTGKDSCSEFTKKSIIKYGLLKSIPYCVEHFKKCRHVYEMNTTTHDSTTKSKDKEVDKCNEACGVLACF